MSPITRTFDNSNFFLGPLEVRVIGSILYMFGLWQKKFISPWAYKRELFWNWENDKCPKFSYMPDGFFLRENRVLALYLSSILMQVCGFLFCLRSDKGLISYASNKESCERGFLLTRTLLVFCWIIKFLNRSLIPKFLLPYLFYNVYISELKHRIRKRISWFKSEEGWTYHTNNFLRKYLKVCEWKNNICMYHWGFLYQQLPLKSLTSTKIRPS